LLFTSGYTSNETGIATKLLPNCVIRRQAIGIDHRVNPAC